MIRRLIPSIVGVVLVLTAVLLAVIWFTCRIWVPPTQCAVLIRKMGTPLPPGQIIATEPGQKGIQKQVLGPGRHFRNPIVWDWEIKPLTVIPSGNPDTWEWTHSLSSQQRNELRAGKFGFKGQFPQIGVVARKVGAQPADGRRIVERDSDEQGILRQVLTPGTYKLNPYIYDVEAYPAVVIPAGFVGVVTNLFGDQPAELPEQPDAEVPGVPDGQLSDQAEAQGDDSVPVDQASQDVPIPSVTVSVTETGKVRPLSKPGERGTLRNVLQPGVYFINPKLQKVIPVEIGFNEYSQTKLSDAQNYRITFPSDTGFTIRVGVTVVWGVDPKHAAEIINAYGNIDGVLDKIIGPQLRSICRNIGSTYAARDFIQGEKREQFQRALTAELQRVAQAKNIEVLLALVREIEVHAPSGTETKGEVTEDLKRTIQQSYIAIEKQITKEKQREAAMVRAQLEEEKKKVEIARETIDAESRVKVAQIRADGEKEAAQVQADAKLQVAQIQQEVAKLDAKRIELLGTAKADVEKMKKGAEAKGYKMLVQAFGSPQAYNLYTFAQNFQPKSIQLIFAGEGTFWTDLSGWQETAAAKLLQQSTEPDKEN